jgi:hypothetical protein
MGGEPAIEIAATKARSQPFGRLKSVGLRRLCALIDTVLTAVSH